MSESQKTLALSLARKLTDSTTPLIERSHFARQLQGCDPGLLMLVESLACAMALIPPLSPMGRALAAQPNN